MRYFLFAFVLIALCSVAVRGSRIQPQIRLFDAQYHNETIGFTIDQYSISSSLEVQGTYAEQYIYAIPSSGYIPLPAVSTPVLPAPGDRRTFYAYTVSDGTVPVTALANLTTTFGNQSYSLFYVARSSQNIYDEQTGDYTPTANFPDPTLFLFEELPTDRELTGSFFKIVNLAGKEQHARTHLFF